MFLGADHGGFVLKGSLMQWLLADPWYAVTDCGDKRFEAEDDFPDYAFAVADRVAAEPGSRGILICRSGGGVAIAANKIAGIRCAVAGTAGEVRRNRTDDDINILALPADYMTQEEAKACVEVFLSTAFSGKERYVRRLRKIAERERGR